MPWLYVFLVLVSVVYVADVKAEDVVVSDELAVVEPEEINVQATLEAELGRDLPDLPEELKNLTPEEIQEFIEAERAEAAAKSGGEAVKTEEQIAAEQAHQESLQKDKEYLEELRKKFKQASDNGNPKAMYFYARFLEMDRDFKASEELMQKAADLGSEDALMYIAAQVPGYALGLWSKDRDDRDAAYENFRLAANNGHVEAQFHLGLMYDEDGDNLTANEWYKKAAYAGHPGAQAIIDMTEKYE